MKVNVYAEDVGLILVCNEWWWNCCTFIISTTTTNSGWICTNWSSSTNSSSYTCTYSSGCDCCTDCIWWNSYFKI